jgi:CRISPR-associated exonuclease Cas4
MEEHEEEIAATLEHEPTGVEVAYFVICPRKLWFFSHQIQMEQESDAVLAGKVIHEQTYNRMKKERLIDEHIRVDFFDPSGILHEVKKSRSIEEAHELQLLYYLYVLKQKGISTKGEINYPTLRRTVTVELTPEKEEKLQKILVEISKIKKLSSPPFVEQFPYCRRCAYYELCWV